MIDEDRIIRPQITFEDFDKVDIRVGKIIEVADFPNERQESYVLEVDFGRGIGVKRTSSQLPQNYNKSELIGGRVAAVMNLGSKKIGPIDSEVLLVGFPDAAGDAVLVRPDLDVPIGGKLF